MRHGTASFEFEPPDESEMTRRMRALLDGGYPYLVAEDGGAVAGLRLCGALPRPAGLPLHGRELDLRRAGSAAPRHRACLLDRLIVECEARNYRLMIAVIGDSAHTSSIELHRTAGFKMVGAFEAVGYKFERWLDSVLMQRPLGKGSSAPP